MEAAAETLRKEDTDDITACYALIELAASLGDDATLIEKRSAELKWLREYDARGALLNQAIISFAPTPEATAKGIEASRMVVGNRWTPEANEKRRQAQLGKPKNHGHKISATKRAKQVKR